MDKINHCINHNRFIPIDTEELTALELIGKGTEKTNELVDKSNDHEEKINKKVSFEDMKNKYKHNDGDFVGSWHGIERPEFSEPGIAGVVAKHTEQLDSIATNEWCKGGFWNVCHKGGVACNSPQNSIEGLEKANEYGYKAIEIDLQMSSDGQWVLFHDVTVDFLTDGMGKLVDKSFAEIQALNYDSTTGGNTTLLQNFYFPVKIPLFRDFLGKAKLFNMCVAIDVNGSRTYNEAEILSLINIIKEFDMEKKVVMWGVDRVIVRKYSTHIALSVNTGSKLSADDSYNIAKPYLPNCIDNRIDVNFDKSIIQGLHNYGIKCMTGFPGNGDKDTKDNVDKWVKEYGLDYAVCDNYLFGGEM